MFKLSSSALALAFLLLPNAAPAQSAPPAASRMSTLGPENAQMARRAGVWDVTETVWASPGAAPVTTHAVAERKMIGAFLQETLHSAAGLPEVLRIDYLSFHRLEGRWKYVSMDMRNPVGIMSAASFGRGSAALIDLEFQPFAVPGAGTVAVAQLMQMEEKIRMPDASHDRKDQYFVLGDGSGKPWLGHQYNYVRRGVSAQ